MNAMPDTTVDAHQATPASPYSQYAVNTAGQRIGDSSREPDSSLELVARVQHAVQRGIESATHGRLLAQRRMEVAAEATKRRIGDRPMRSVLLAAGTGAAIAALIALALRRQTNN